MGRRAAHRWILDVGAMAAAARVNLVRGGRVGQAGVNRPKGNEGDLAGDHGPFGLRLRPGGVRRLIVCRDAKEWRWIAGT